ncbi:MAG: hypothetical protein BWY28_02952 [bacterium ADurb.Bin236]|nr:MAG: hypothetical protein BWY28_02952 [bacterium ADurb.Bin236]HOY62527.1 SxtJ family membrane protein [bacterium]HPN95101.1 SxtJ family membrane protein [bacterium]
MSGGDKNNELKQAARFALTAFIATGALAALAAARGKPVAAQALASLSAYMFAARFILPGILLKPTFNAVTAAARALGWVNAAVALGLAYFFVFAPVAMVLRAARRDFMLRRFDPKAETYWHETEQKPLDPKRYEQRF